MSLRAVNLNLIPVLRALLRQKSVTGAAKALGLSQSAASDALSKLRYVLKDPLLIRVGTHMELTPRALELAGAVEVLCESIEAFLSNKAFDPSSARRTVVIAASDYAIFLMANLMLEKLRTLAPNINIRFIDAGDQLTNQLTSREIDFALVPSFYVEDLAPAHLLFRPLVKDVAVALFRQGHRLATSTRITQKQLRASHLLLFQPGSQSIERKRFSIFTGGGEHTISAQVPQVTLLPHLLLGTDSVAIAPKRLALRMAELLPLEFRPFSFPTQKVEMGLVWSPIQDNDPAHKWFRDAVTSAIVETMKN